MIDINPLLHQLPAQQNEALTSAASPAESKNHDTGAEDRRTSPAGSTSVYSVPVPPGYATPSNVPLITPAYTTPVIIRHLSMDDDGKVAHSAVESLYWCFIFYVLRRIVQSHTGFRDFPTLCPRSVFQKAYHKEMGTKFSPPQRAVLAVRFFLFPEKKCSYSRIQACGLAYWRACTVIFLQRSH